MARRQDGNSVWKSQDKGKCGYLLDKWTALLMRRAFCLFLLFFWFYGCFFGVFFFLLSFFFFLNYRYTTTSL